MLIQILQNFRHDLVWYFTSTLYTRTPPKTLPSSLTLALGDMWEKNLTNYLVLKNTNNYS